jgi:hypothetical protein
VLELVLSSAVFVLVIEPMLAGNFDPSAPLNCKAMDTGVVQCVVDRLGAFSNLV